MVKSNNQNNVEMQDVENTPEAEEPSSEKKDTDLLTFEDVREQLRQIERGVQSKEPRYILRVLRSLPATRRKLTAAVIRRLINGYYPNGSNKETLIGFTDEPMEIDGATQKARVPKSVPTQILPEIDVYLHLLVLLKLIDANRFPEATLCSENLIQKIISHNRRTMDLIAARCYFYHSRVFELTNKLERVREFLHSRLRTTTLRNDFEGQAVLISCLLRNYLHFNLYSQADKFVSKTVFPESASNNEWARYLYYLGRIKAAQLDYSDAHRHLIQAQRKAPQSTAVGFRQTVQKLTVVVELLLGDIPERATFREPQLRRALEPYFQLTKSVKLGNLQLFNEFVERFAEKFQTDNTYTLILRLRHNVIKTALKKLTLSYSRLTLAEVARKLQLGSEEDAEFIVAKAIRDGVIEATIDHEKRYLQSRETGDVYCTHEPQLAFHQRIKFCLDLHNQSVRAMRFPPKSYQKDLESAEDRREREQQDLELAKEMAEEDEDGFP